MAESNPLCGTDWGRLLKDEFAQSDWNDLVAWLERSRGSFYPPPNEVFRALELTWCEQTKVVIIGQDPYRGIGQAHGLCFSVPCDVQPPPSLVNIHKELETDRRIERPDHGSLEPWAHRGVLLLNAALTVPAVGRGSHRGRWARFTDAVIRLVTEESDPVFLLWGEQAQRKAELITRITGSPGKIIKSSHPSPLSARRPCRDSPPFIDSKPFSKANEMLRRARRRGIDWGLSP